MGDRRCICGHLESEHLGGDVTLCAVREDGGSDGLYADFCLSFTEAEAAPAEIKALADYPAPNKWSCPHCSHPSDLHGQMGHKDIWVCPYCYTRFETETLNHGH